MSIKVKLRISQTDKWTLTNIESKQSQRLALRQLFGGKKYVENTKKNSRV